MNSYRLAKENFHFSHSIPELRLFGINAELACESGMFDFGYGVPKLISSTKGWVANKERLVEVYNVSDGILLKVDGCGEFLIAPNGETICKRNPYDDFTKMDRDVILGPGLVLALALRGVWSLHASAVMRQNKTLVFLGESGQGKSTLAGCLSVNSVWRLVADDILPVRTTAEGVYGLPHFPQLKLSAQAQPGPGLPECLPFATLCILTSVDQDTMPELQLLPPSLAIQVLLRHTAGTRMFTPQMLGEHLTFCAQIAGQVPVYQLSYPHRRDILPVVQNFLETLC